MYTILYQRNLQEFKINQSFHYKRTLKSTGFTRTTNENYKTATISMSS